MKIRITATIVREYEPKTEYYDNQTPDGMLATDLSGAGDDPFLFFDSCEWDIRGEIIQGDEK
jgi:hypothetical protein